MRYLLLIFWLLSYMAMPSGWATVTSSRSFDGTNDEVDWGNVVDVTTNDVSYCIWYKATEDATLDVWIGKRNGGDPNVGYVLQQLASDVTNCRCDDNTTTQVASGTADTDGAWYFACCIWDSANDDLFVYENGSQVGSDITGTVGSLTNTLNLQSGETADNGGDALGSVAFGSIFTSKQLTVVEMLEIMWKPEGIADSVAFVAPIMGDATEPEWVAKLSGTVSGTDAANGSGPPVFFGLGLPL